MKSYLIFFFFLLSFLDTGAQQTKNPMPVLELTGTAYERGYTHGYILKKSIAELYSKWKKSIRKETGKDPDSVISDFLHTSKYQEAIRKWTPDLLEEVRGIAEGSGQSFDDVFAFQLIDEYWGYLDRLEHGSVDKDHCSAIGIAATKEHSTIVAQNVDIDTFMQGHQVIFHIMGSPNEPEQLIVSSAGFIGFVGVNTAGLGIVINALTDLNNSVDGLPVTFVTRGALKKSPSEALKFLKKIKHATGQNYIVGTKSRVYNYEASANEVIEFFPTPDPDLVYHTNHSIGNHDVKPWMQEYHRRILTEKNLQSNSLTRYNSLAKRLKSTPSTEKTSWVKNILRSKDDPRFPICVSYDPNSIAFTFSSVLFVLDETPYMEVTNGSPDVSDYQKIKF